MPHAVTEEKKLNHIHTQNKSLMTQKIFSFYYNISLFTYFPVLMAQMVKNLPAMWETQVRSLGQEDPLEKGMAIHSSILAWRIPWTDATVHGVTKTQTRLSDEYVHFSLSCCEAFRILVPYPRDQISGPCNGSRVLTTRLSRKSPISILHQLIFADQLIKQSKKMYYIS